MSGLANERTAIHGHSAQNLNLDPSLGLG